ncbi:hypothetical protein BAG01nite_03170 [Brevibacillus agri]|uniref:Uncharacterized protein n=1 Tax=Brevibacillus agri TaxID=51101 RepID=A0ABQ0SKA5_9BACL|nr:MULTISPECIES: hypothetical protein [Brevibacillus]MBG9568921.1 hypothetical protein [Brevibacillus agri]MBY0051430.1 hypothetical protein [Brevibacillus agri]MDN4091858.1 hypothetical protein [Brevibacillus agri]MDR9503130.1 hypothetical protein [Brevibacillus agri]MED1643178.1 hypothetical protein [Brevibacillus agri]
MRQSEQAGNSKKGNGRFVAFLRWESLYFFASATSQSARSSACDSTAIGSWNHELSSPQM